MKVTGLATIAIAALLLATPAYSQQERREEGKDHPEQQRGKQESAKPEAQHQPAQRAPQPQRQPAQPRARQQQPRQETQRAQQQQHAPQPDRQQHNQQSQHAQQEPRTVPRPPQHAQQQPQRQPGQRAPQPQQHARQQTRQSPQRVQQQQRIQRSAWQSHGSQHWATDHRNWQQRGGYRGYRIPDERFRGYFGPSHDFRIHGLPFLVVGGYPRFQYQGYWISAVDPYPASWGPDWYDNDDVYVNYVDNGYYLYNRRDPGVAIAINISL